MVAQVYRQVRGSRAGSFRAPATVWSYYTANRWWPCLGVGLPDLRIHRPPYSLSLCIDDYGNEASLVTLTYTLFACSRSRLCAILYAAFTRPIILYTWRSGFISCLLIETLRLPRTARSGCLGNCQKALDTPSNEGGLSILSFPSRIPYFGRGIKLYRAGEKPQVYEIFRACIAEKKGESNFQRCWHRPRFVLSIFFQRIISLNGANEGNEMCSSSK